MYTCQVCCSRWFVTFDGQECESEKIDQVIETAIGSKDWTPLTVRGMCQLQKKGQIKIALNVGTCIGKKQNGNEPDTGYGVTSRIFIEEVESVVELV